MKNDNLLTMIGANVLITGGAGFVGSNLARSLLRENVGRIQIVDNLLSSERDNIPDDPRVYFTEGSIADNRILKDLCDEYDFIFHLATYHGNQNSIHNPLEDHDNNLLTTLNLFEKIKNFRHLRKVVYAAAGCAVADKTFDDCNATLEDAPISLQMDSPYSISKIVGEFYAVYFYHQHHLPTVRARFQNVYGPGEILGAGRWRGTPATVWRNVIPTFIYKAINKEPLPLEGGGVATRDFIFVEDIIRGLISCALKGTSGDVYNLASGVETSILKLGELINELTDNTTPLSILPKREWDHSGRRFGATAKAREQLGFEAEINIYDGLKRTISWTEDNITTINACIAKHQVNLINTVLPQN